MKLFTAEGVELIEVTGIHPSEGGIEIEGTIMGAMPMKAMLRPRELRTGMRFMTFRLMWTLIAMLFRRD